MSDKTVPRHVLGRATGCVACETPVGGLQRVSPSGRTACRRCIREGRVDPLTGVLTPAATMKGK